MKNRISNGQRAEIKLRLLRKAKTNPKFKLKLELISKIIQVQKPKEPVFQSEAHKENYIKGLEYQQKIDKSKIDWEAEKRRQAINARDW